jgi:hypothetical protein
VNAEVLRAGDPVVLPHVGRIGRLWSAVLDVADRRAHGWTLIGALMVMLHEHEAGTPTRPATADVDAVVDARGATDATRTMAMLLQASRQVDLHRLAEGIGVTTRLAVTVGGPGQSPGG